MIVGAHVHDRDDYTIVPPAQPPTVVWIPPLPGDNEDLAIMQAPGIREEFQLGYAGRGSLKAEDSPQRLRQATEYDQGSDGESGTAPLDRTPRLRPVSSYAPPPASRVLYARRYSAHIPSAGPSSVTIRNATPGPSSAAATGLDRGAMVIDALVAPPPGTVWPAQTLLQRGQHPSSQVPTAALPVVAPLLAAALAVATSASRYDHSANPDRISRPGRRWNGAATC